MAQRFCEVCNDPLPLETEESMCDSCLEVVELQVAEINEAEECETPASVVEPSSNETPAETRTEDNRSTSENAAVLVATVASELGNLDLGMEESLSPANPQPKKPAPSLACDSCGVLQYELKKFKAPTTSNTLDLCDKCYEGEMALVVHAEDPMQGKVVHPDESEREEIITMDVEDAELYNAEVRISMESPIEEVYARIALLEGKLQRAKLLLKASRTTLFVRIEHMKSAEREAEYKRLNERDAKKRRRVQPVSADGTTPAPKRSVSRAPKRSKAQQFRDSMLANGFSEEWIAEQIKKRGIEG
jgi:hypothetical protein